MSTNKTTVYVSFRQEFSKMKTSRDVCCWKKVSQIQMTAKRFIERMS